MLRLVYLFPIISTATWGVSIVGAKIVGNSGFTPIEIVFGRYILASFMFIPILLYQSRFDNQILPKHKEWLPIIGLSLSGVAVNNIIFYEGLARTDASVASLLVATTPLYTMIFAVFMLSEDFTLRKFISIIIGGLGVVLIIGLTENQGKLAGNILILIALMIWGSSFSFSKISSNSGISAITITAWSEILGSLFITPLILYNRSLSKFTKLALFSEVFLWFVFLGGVSSVIAYILHYKSIEVLGISKVAPTTNIIPLSGVVASYLILGEQISGRPIFGFLLILLGVVIVQTDRGEVK